MKNVLKKYWRISIILSFLLFLPIFINYFYNFNAPYKTWQKPSDWTVFWSTYLAAIASLGMIIITARSIRINKSESQDNRKLQIAVLNYQLNRQYIADANSKFLDYLNALNIGFIISLPSLVWPPIKRETILPELISIRNSSKISNYRLELSLSLIKSQKAIEFTDNIAHFQESINALSDDINWLLTLPIPSECRNQFDSYDPVAISDFFNSRVLFYKDSVKSPTYSCTRVWTIITNLDFSTIDESELERTIIEQLVCSLKFKELQQEGKLFFETEINNLESNLTNYVESAK